MPKLHLSMSLLERWDLTYIRKFARYFEVEARILPVSKESKYCLDITKVKAACDENTIGIAEISIELTRLGIFVILGSTYTGHYEPVEKVSNLLDELQKETGLDIPIHVDGASGGLFCPFATPSVKFGFHLPRVKSINVYGPSLDFNLTPQFWPQVWSCLRRCRMGPLP
jgi:glutamate decarboxylase